MEQGGLRWESRRESFDALISIHDHDLKCRDVGLPGVLSLIGVTHAILQQV